MGNNGISFELLSEIERVLIIIFIIATVLANLTFLLKCRRVSEVLNKSVYCSRIFLSLGCIVLALFSYVVMARGFFFDADEVKKLTRITSQLYFFSFFPFVFGCGLLLQGLSLMSNLNTPFKRASCMLGPKIKSLMAAILPWALGLVLVCTLVFIDSESKGEGDCFGSELSRSTFVAITIICTIIPAIVALVCSVVLITKARQNPLERIGNRPVTSTDPLVPSAPNVAPDSRQPRLVPAIQPQYPVHTYTEKYPQQGPLDSPPQYPQSYPPHPHSPQLPQSPPVPQTAHSPQNPQSPIPDSPPQYSQLYPQQFPQPLAQPYGTQVHSQQYLQLYSRQYPHQYDVPSSSPQPHNQGGPIYATPITTTPHPDDDGATWRSKVIHLVVCIVFAVSVLPASLLRLGMSCGALRELEEEELVVLHVIFTWLLFVYPLAVPSLWSRGIKA